MPTLKQWIDCVNLPVAKCNKYRERHGLDALPGARATEQVCGSCVFAGIVLGHIMAWVSYWLEVRSRR